MKFLVEDLAHSNETTSIIIIIFFFASLLGRFLGVFS